MHRTVVLNCVGLTPALIGEYTPRLREFLARGRGVSVASLLPALTCAVQATYLTGHLPRDHGIVANGWYDRDEADVKFWKQSSHLVQRPRVWDVAKKIDPNFTSANICWWYAMYSDADYTVTPRPMYLADGRKLPDCWTHPATLRDDLQRTLGPFPLFKFWGPLTSIESTRWIADAALHVEDKFHPTLSFVYLPHLDYVLQRVGPDLSHRDVQKDLQQLDNVAGYLIDSYTRAGCRVIVLSEYGISKVHRPVHLNRVLREHGLLTVRVERGREILDAGASRAFVVADHQVAHVYVKEPDLLPRVQELLSAQPGVAQVLDETTQHEVGLDHPRSGDLIALADPDAWFTYYFWMDDTVAPDYARTVDIHRKPGYDPVELFLDPHLNPRMLRVGMKLLRRKLGFRGLLDVIPLDASLVKGSHGVAPSSPDHGPLFISSEPDLLRNEIIKPTDVFGLILEHLNAKSE